MEGIELGEGIEETVNGVVRASHSQRFVVHSEGLLLNRAIESCWETQELG